MEYIFSQKHTNTYMQTHTYTNTPSEIRMDSENSLDILIRKGCDCIRSGYLSEIMVDKILKIQYESRV